MNKRFNEIESSSESFLKVHDFFTLDGNSAFAKRTLILTNNSDSDDLPYNFSKRPFTFFYLCDNFNVLIVNNKTQTVYQEKDLRVKECDYCKTILIPEETITLGPKEKLTITIDYCWKDFYQSHILMHIVLADLGSIADEYILTFNGLNLSSNKFEFLVDGKPAIRNRDYFMDMNDDITFPDLLKLSSYEERLKLEILILSTPEFLPTLRFFTNAFIEKNINMENISIILVQHLLSDATHLIDSLVSTGIKKNNIYIFGIPYSSKQNVYSFLKSTGFNNVYFISDYEVFEKSIENILPGIFRDILSNGNQVLIIEDGGYVVPLIHYKKDEIPEIKAVIEKNLIIGAIEQTANGIWRDEDISKVNHLSYLFPIINVAGSKIKATFESPLIGTAARKQIESILSRFYYGIARRHFGLIGYGSIGSEIAKALKAEKGIVQIFDSDVQKRLKAKNDGFDVAENIVDIIRHNQFLIEASGNIWLNDDQQLKLVKNNTIYFNATSKRKGIDYSNFRSYCNISKTINLPNLGKKYQLLNDSSINLIADGYPVNFFNSESVPDKEIEFIHVLLFYPLCFLLNKNDLYSAFLSKGVEPPNSIISMDDYDNYPVFENFNNKLISVFDSV